MSNAPTFIGSAHWVPEELRGEDMRWRYVGDITAERRSQIEQLVNDEEFQARFTAYLPSKEKTPERGAGELLQMLATLSPDESIAGSQIVDAHLTKEIGNGVLIVEAALNDIDLTRFQIRQVIYESMPTDVYFETLGGFSLAKIQINDGDPETTEAEHVHNGGRLVIALSPESTLVLPNQTVTLHRGNAVWMPPFTLHSFQAGEFLALHPSEAGFDHPEAFVPHR